MQKKRITIVLIIIFLLIVGCTEFNVDNQEDKIQKMYWVYYDNPELIFTWNQYYNPFNLHEIDAIIVPFDATTYSFENALRIDPCTASSRSLDFCIHPLALRNKGFSGKLVGIYIVTGITWNLALKDEPRNISEIPYITEAERAYAYFLQVPGIDEDGFVDMEFVDRDWCWAETGEDERGENKPLCEEIINKLKESDK